MFPASGLCVISSQPAIKRYIMLKNKNACTDFAFFRVVLELKGKLRPLTVEKKLLPANTGKYVTGKARLLYMHGSPFFEAIKK